MEVILRFKGETVEGGHFVDQGMDIKDLKKSVAERLGVGAVRLAAEGNLNLKTTDGIVAGQVISVYKLTQRTAEQRAVLRVKHGGSTRVHAHAPAVRAVLDSVGVVSNQVGEVSEHVDVLSEQVGELRRTVLGEASPVELAGMSGEGKRRYHDMKRIAAISDLITYEIFTGALICL